MITFIPVTADEKLSHALAQAKIRGPEISALLHSAFHDGAYLPEGRMAERIRDARENVERLLVAVLAAEQALESSSAVEPAAHNGPVAGSNPASPTTFEPFPGGGAYS